MVVYLHMVNILTTNDSILYTILCRMYYISTLKVSLDNNRTGMFLLHPCVSRHRWFIITKMLINETLILHGCEYN